MEYVGSEKAEYVRATTPAVKAYVEAYRKQGFKPFRRDFRIGWQIDEVPSRNDPRIETIEVSDETVGQAGEVFVRSLSPFWDWRTEEEGGAALVAKSFQEDGARGARWLLAKRNQDVAGLTGIIPDYYGEGVAWFRGAMVLPEHRGKGVGSVLMSRIAEFAKRLRQREMVVYTFSYLDSLAPGALLYLRSGGNIEAEYLMLIRA